MSERRDFPLGDILAVVHNKPFGPGHMGGVYAVMEFILGPNVAFGLDLTEARMVATGRILEQHSDLRAAVLPRHGLNSEAEASAWVAEQVDRFGAYRTLTFEG